MYLKNIGIGIITIFVFVACEDILEEPDISGSQIELLAPTDGGIIFDNRINFNWNGLEDATAYSIQVALPSFENASQIVLDSLIVQDTLGNITTRIDQQLFFNGTYQWRVKGLNGGFETPYTIAGFSVQGDENIDLVPPNTPVLLSPTDGTSQDDTEVDFAWAREDISGSTERDSIYIFSDEALQILETKGLGANKTFTLTLSADTFFWFVKAFDAAGNESSDSEVFEFTIN